jgi:hypothetical protein
VEVDDELLLLVRELAALDVRAEVVGSPEAAALAAPVEPGEVGEAGPVAMAVLLDVVDEELVLLRIPRALLHAGLLLAAAR